MLQSANLQYQRYSLLFFAGHTTTHTQSAPFLLTTARTVPFLPKLYKEEEGGGEMLQTMERKVVIVCVIVGILGLISAALGFAAEATRVKVSDVQTSTPGECIYPGSPALALGLIASVVLMMAQAIINAVAGCICCKRNPNPSDANWTVALISFIVSWVTFIIAFLLLLMGAALNDQRGEERMYFGDFCYVVKPGVFSGGAVLSLASVSLGIVYYVALSTSKNIQSWGTQQNQVVEMGRPQIPPMSTQPVFVPEDTYNRQQLP